MRAYFAEKNGLKRAGIAAMQASLLREYLPGRRSSVPTK
jgi:hypothetical protein